MATGAYQYTNVNVDGGYALEQLSRAPLVIDVIKWEASLFFSSNGENACEGGKSIFIGVVEVNIKTLLFKPWEP